MAMNTQKVELDVSKRGQVMPVLYLGQGDKRGTTLAASIYDNGAALALSGYAVRFSMLLPNGADYYRESGTASGNVATFQIDETYAAAVAGTTDTAYVEVLSGSSVIASTNRMRVVVLRSATEGLTPGSAYESSIDRAMRQLEEGIEAAGSATSAATSAASSANNAAASASNAASSANSAASSATSAASSATSAALSATTAAGNASSAASAANAAKQGADAAAAAANAAASNAYSAAAGADTAAQAASAAASATANVVEEAVRALSEGSRDGYGGDMAEVGRLLCGDGYALDGWLYVECAQSGGMLRLAESRSWGDGWLEFDAHGCGCGGAAAASDLAAAEERIAALESALASLRSDVAAAVRASALDGFVLDGWMVSNGASASGGLLSVPTGAVAGGYMTVSATS